MEREVRVSEVTVEEVVTVRRERGEREVETVEGAEREEREMVREEEEARRGERVTGRVGGGVAALADAAAAEGERGPPERPGRGPARESRRRRKGADLSST